MFKIAAFAVQSRFISPGPGYHSSSGLNDSQHYLTYFLQDSAVMDLPLDWAHKTDELCECCSLHQ